MKPEQRRKEMLDILMAESRPVLGSSFAERFGVSRQIIVQDISVLKAAGYEILSTHHGYFIHKSPFAERVFKVYHLTEQTEDELNCIVEHGGTVVNVYVWHKVYGKIEAPLNISSKAHIQKFIEGVRSGKSTELFHITGGYHYHTVRARFEEYLDQIEQELRERGYLVPEI